MKNLFLASCFLLIGVTAHAQFAFGLKGGVNTQVAKPQDIVIGGGDTTLNFGVEKFKYGTQFGAFMRIGERVFLQPELMFNSNKTDYRIRQNTIGDVVKNERYQYLDMPLLLGFKAGPLRFMGGPVGHVFLNSNSELTDIKGYAAKFKQMNWGWQAGLTLGTGHFALDLRYEGNFNNQGDHITFFGDQYQFANTPSRLIVGLNVALVK
ncbi:MAG TPA: porin family protein [Saprospiraceae bacterium]|nr:porin family protein [Saprospiraceae bacterium]